MKADDLLLEVANKGWTEESAKRFLSLHDKEVKRQILYCMMKMRFIRNEDELGQLRRQLHGR